MPVDRRDFLKGLTLGAAGLTLTGGSAKATAPSIATDGFGVLVDTTLCIGCRKCEFACGEAAGIRVPPIESFDAPSVFDQQRHPTSKSLTVINRYGLAEGRQAQAFVKTNCLHCLDPACVSACLVGALQRDATGAVTYDAGKCMGCRYCMIACPFQIPAYEYEKPLTPRVTKCTFCLERIRESGGVPACVKICPREALIFGKRTELLQQAHQRIAEQPDRYRDHIYGEHEVGGTSWLYLADRPFSELGFIEAGALPPHRLTETIQHSVFRFWLPPMMLYGILALVAWLTRGFRHQPVAKETRSPTEFVSSSIKPRLHSSAAIRREEEVAS